MLPAAVLWLLSLYVVYLAIRFGVQHGIEGARRSSEERHPEHHDRS